MFLLLAMIGKITITCMWEKKEKSLDAGWHCCFELAIDLLAIDLLAIQLAKFAVVQPAMFHRLKVSIHFSSL